MLLPLLDQPQLGLVPGLELAAVEQVLERVLVQELVVEELELGLVQGLELVSVLEELVSVFLALELVQELE